MTTGDSYPLTFVELSRWNADLPISLGCPRHRSPETMVAGYHETVGYPMWICGECGYATPVLDDELTSTLGATNHFTDHAHSAQLRPDTRLVVLPPIAATDHATGTVAVRTRAAVDAAARTTAATGGIAAGLLLAFLVGALSLAPLATALTVLAGAGAVAAATYRWHLGRARDRHATITATPATIPAGHVLTGAWLTRPSAPVDASPWPWPETAAAITRNRAARVLQVARLGATSQIRITTTAAVLTFADTAPVGVAEMTDPALNDFTYHPRG